MTETFWATHQVGGPYATLEQSEAALRDRAALYPELEELMPTNFPGKVVLDYGCGPGHDVIQFLSAGAKEVMYWDTSQLAFEIASRRIELHGFLHRAGWTDVSWYLPSVDLLHCAGVLHHAEGPLHILRRMRLMAPEVQIMIYDGDASEHTQSEVPITHWWTRAEFIRMAKKCGFQARYRGSYECSAAWRPNCYAACFHLT